MIREYSRRLLWLMAGLVVSSVGVAMLLQANIGSDPWSVLHQGIAKTFGMSYGVASVIVGAAIIAVAVACGESFGLGTLGGIFICGPIIDLVIYLGWVPVMERFWPGVLMLLCGLEVLALGTWMYMKSALGTGPRDALMVVLAKRTGRSVGFCRAAAELIAVLVGWLMGGQVGAGTVISAFGLGALFNLNFALLRFRAAEIRQENLLETLRRLRDGETSDAP